MPYNELSFARENEQCSVTLRWEGKEGLAPYCHLQPSFGFGFSGRTVTHCPLLWANCKIMIWLRFGAIVISLHYQSRGMGKGRSVQRGKGMCKENVKKVFDQKLRGTEVCV